MSLRLSPDELIAIIYRDSPLAQEQWLTSAQLITENLILNLRGKTKLLHRLFGDSHQHLQRVIEKPLTNGTLGWKTTGLRMSETALRAAVQYLPSGDFAAFPTIFMDKKHFERRHVKTGIPQPHESSR